MPENLHADIPLGMKIFIIIGFLFVVSSCATSKKEAPNQYACISKSEINSKKTELLPLFERLTDKPKGKFKNEWQLMRDECWKKSFQVDDIYVLLYRDLYSQKVLGLVGDSEWTQAPESCLGNAIKLLDGFGAKAIKNVIRNAKTHKSAIWEDRDVGPVTFLNCKEQKGKTWRYYSSVELLAHELNHYASDKSKNCSYDPFRDQQDCIRKSLEDSALGSIKPKENWTGVNSEVVAGLKRTQQLYIQNAKAASDPLILLDELRSYIVGLRTKSTILEMLGQNAIYGKDNKRAFHAPLMAMYEAVSRYRSKRLEANETFQKMKLNHLMKQTLNDAQEAVEAWNELEDRIGKPQSKARRAENKIWKLVSSRSKES